MAGPFIASSITRHGFFVCMRAVKRRAPGCLGLGHRGSKTPLCYRVYAIILYPIIGIPITARISMESIGAIFFRCSCWAAGLLEARHGT